MMQINKSTNLSSVELGLRLARKRYSFRLPLELASRLEALFEMHPQKPRAHLLADLLRLGLAEVERVQSAVAAGLAEFHPNKRQPIYLLTGPFAEFHGLTRKHHLAMEHELAKDDAESSSSIGEYSLGDAE
jgi:predicted DNA-binding protein